MTFLLGLLVVSINYKELFINGLMVNILGKFWPLMLIEFVSKSFISGVEEK